jgi:hypothetical protein
MMSTRTITLPADQWEAILEVVQDHWDEGPPGEGWQGSRLSAASAALSTALAQTEPEGPTDEELLRCYGLAKRDHCYEGPMDDWPKRAERAATVHGLRAVLAHFARPAIEPVPVAERLPGAEDCDSRGWCWYWHPGEECWEMVPVVTGTLDVWTYWLPHHALPLPTPTP